MQLGKFHHVQAGGVAQRPRRGKLCIDPDLLSMALAQHSFRVQARYRVLL